LHIDGESQKGFTFEELYDFMEEIPTRIFDGFFAEYNNMKGSLDFKLETICNLCATENSINFESIPNFLWV